MAKSSIKQSSSKPKKNSSSKPSNSKTSSSSTVPVNRSWQDPSLDQGQRSSAQSLNASYPVGRWLTEPSWQEPFNTIAEVPAAVASSAYVGGHQGSGAAATYATSRRHC